MFEKSPNEWGIASVLQKPSVLDPYFPSPWQSKYKHLTEVVPITQWLWNRSQWSEEEGTLQMFSGDRWLEWLQLNAEASLIDGCIPRGGSCDSVSAVSMRQTSIIWFPEAVQLCLWLIRSAARFGIIWGWVASKSGAWISRDPASYSVYLQWILLLESVVQNQFLFFCYHELLLSTPPESSIT